MTKLMAVAAMVWLLAGCSGPKTGGLEILSVPGVRVLLDDHDQGETGADGLLLEGVPIGPHRVRVDRDGYHSQELTVKVIPKRTITLAFNRFRADEGSPEPASAPDDDPAAMMARPAAEGPYAKGDASKALAILDGYQQPDIIALRTKIEQVLDAYTRAKKKADAGEHEEAAPHWDRILLLEGDPENFYHKQARELRRR